MTPNDKIKVLEDTDGDGVADKVTVFCSDLNAAMGVCVAGSKVYVPESPNLYVYTDANGDLVADGPRQLLLTGFGGKNHDHGVHSQVFGPDHKLYMTNGDTSYDVTGPDGRRIQYKWGGMIRCEADGSQLEDFAVNFRNPVELAVDSFGNVWCSDNDNDGLKSVRICWILEGELRLVRRTREHPQSRWQLRPHPPLAGRQARARPVCAHHRVWLALRDDLLRVRRVRSQVPEPAHSLRRRSP